MKNDYALVLTGEVLPGFEPASVWPQLAAHLRVEPQKLAQLLPHTPRTIKQDGDVDKLRGLQAGIMQVGAQTEIHPADERPALYVMLEGTPRGPMPRAMVQRRIELGYWADSISVNEAGSEEWKPFRELSATAQPAPVAGKLAQDSGDEKETDTAGTLSVLPEGAEIYAGFWWRCAAMGIDGLILGLVNMALLGMALPFIIVAGLSEGRYSADAFRIVLPVVLLSFVFWYFPWKQSSVTQSTYGMRALGVKIVDKYGRRIGIKRAVMRFFPMAVIGIAIFSMFLFTESFLSAHSILVNAGPANFFVPSEHDLLPVRVVAGINIALVVIWVANCLMVAWTKRKQTLYDMMAGTFVVFDDVEPGHRPMPAQRPPMPRFGMVFNTLLLAFMFALVVLAFATPKFIQDTQEALVKEAHDRPIRNKNKPLKDRIHKAADAVKYGRMLGYVDDKIDCRPLGEFPIPEDPALGTVRITNEGAGVCSATITFAQSDDLPVDLRGGEIILKHESYWKCYSILPEKYLPAYEDCKVSPYGFVAVYMPDDTPDNVVLVFAPANCPREGAQRAARLMDALRDAKVPARLLSSYYLSAVPQEPDTERRLRQLRGIMGGEQPAVLIGGMGKANPTAAETIGEYRRQQAAYR